jgi:hypothetical protein
MQQLMQLQHSNGLPVAVLYCGHAVRQLLLDHRPGCKHGQGPTSSSGKCSSSKWVVPEPSVLACFRERHGPVVCFNLLRPDGSWVGHKEVAKLAAIHNLCLRTGKAGWSAPVASCCVPPFNKAPAAHSRELPNTQHTVLAVLSPESSDGLGLGNVLREALCLDWVCETHMCFNRRPPMLYVCSLMCLQAASATQAHVPTTWASPAVTFCHTTQQDMCAGMTLTSSTGGPLALSGRRLVT